MHKYRPISEQIIHLLSNHKHKYFFRALLVFLFLTPILILGTLELLISYKREVDNLHTHKQLSTSLATTAINERLDSFVELGVSLAGRPNLIKMIEDDKNWIGSIKMLENVSKNFPIIDRIVIFDTDGVIKNMLPFIPGNIGTSRRDRDWYQLIKQDWKPHISEVFLRVSKPQTNIVGLAIPIIGIKSQKPIAILFLQIKLNNFYDWAQRYKGGKGEFIVIVDHKGHVVYNPWMDLQKEIVDASNLPAVKKMLEGNTGVEEYYSPYLKEDVLTAYKQIPKYGWGVLVVQPTRFAFAEIRRGIINHIIIFSIFIIVFAILIISTMYLVIKNKNAKDREIELIRKTSSSELAKTTAAAVAESEKIKTLELQEMNQQLVAANLRLSANERALQASQSELQTKLSELERFNKIMVGREIEMIKLKEEINSLLEQEGKTKKYNIPKVG
ncbi:MAG: hypothetical protein HQK51_08105 [Oligoflexia bacterium]|nr:hypothetical protein [Oligoflexia bacterium]